VYYVRCTTRSSGASSKGTPRQALAYITDAHERERDPSCSGAELAYIARLDPGWKTTLEGGRVPLVGLGALQSVTDAETLSRKFEAACQPYHDRRGSTGYLSWTFTMPKELSLFAEGHREQAREAMYAGIQAALDAAFPDKDYKAVTAIHTRNEAGEVHFHAHVLIGKFARDRARGRVYSLNSASGGNTGRQRVRVLKEAWWKHLDAELEARIGLKVQQGAPFAKPALVQVHDFVARAISGHATAEMHDHYSTVNGDEVRAGLGRVISLVGLAATRGGYAGGYAGGSDRRIRPRLQRELLRSRRKLNR
jgi:hypothetical protein